MTQYSVNIWGSHPDDNNDDCWEGGDYSTREEALEVFNNPKGHFVSAFAYIEIDGPDLYKVRKNPDYVPEPDDDDDWRREMAMEAGMLHGIDAYNEMMGWD